MVLRGHAFLLRNVLTNFDFGVILEVGGIMISDTLSDASAEIREYLSNPATARCYTEPEVRKEIDGVLEHMDRVRKLLDTPPKG